MSSFGIFLVCLQAYLIQNAFCYVIEPACGAGLASPWGIAGPAALGTPFGVAPGYAPEFAPGYAPGFAPALAYEGIGAYGGEGVGDVAVAGEMPVAGTTMVNAQVPILGAVRFAGDLPAGGVVTIAGSCGCGRTPYVC